MIGASPLLYPRLVREVVPLILDAVVFKDGLVVMMNAGRGYNVFSPGGPDDC